LIELSFQTGDFDEAVAAARELVPRLRKASHFELLGFALGMLAGALTFRGDLDDALSSAREAAPLLQENAMLFWLFDHLALRLALAGKTHDAARVAGYADAEVGKLDRSRDPVGIRAMERIDKLLRRTLRAGQLNELKKEGALLKEEQVLALALSA